MGRFFHASDEQGFGSAPYLVLTYGYWHNRFHDDRGVVGRTVQINKHPFTIIGVAPPDFRGTLVFGSPDFFLPIVNQDQIDGQFPLTDRGTSNAVFETVGRLKPGVTPAQAIADVNAVCAYLAKTYPREFSQKSAVLGTNRTDFVWRGRPGISRRADAARRADFAGRVRQPRKPVCSSCRGPLARSRAATRAGVEP